MSNNDDKSLDLIGIGKLAKAIPESVYKQTTEAITTAFEKIIAPITETTSGLGRYIRQKFDNMVEVEKSILTYSLQNAQEKINKNGKQIKNIAHPKELIKILEEISKETDPLLNVLWTNILCSELTNDNSHPFFVNILQSFSVKEAILLETLNSFHNIGEVNKNVLIFRYTIDSWMKENGGEINMWDFSCKLLCEFGLADTITPLNHINGRNTIILYRTDIGEEFLNAVNN